MAIPKYRVSLWESERGWGTKHWADKDFDTLEDAEMFYTAENAKNNKTFVPDWYVYAERPRFVDAEKDPPRNG